MKLVLRKGDFENVEITIKYKEMNRKLSRIISEIKRENKKILVTDLSRNSKRLIEVEAIFYIDTANNKSFVYSEEEVFEVNQKLYSLLEELAEFDFCQVNKSQILNMKVLEKVETMPNSRLKGILKNGEQVIITRTYIPSLKQKLKEVK